MRSFYPFACFIYFATASVVHELTSTNFDSFIAEHELCLISFVAPWCNYCHELAPEFETTAKRLQDEGLPLGRVDCEEEKDLCKEHNVYIYPTIQVFHGKDEHYIYNEFRKSDAMVSFVKRHSYPLITALSSISDVLEFKTKDNVTVVGYFDEKDEASESTFATIAQMYRDLYLFGSISSDTFGQAEEVNKPSIVLYKSFDEGKNLYTQSFNIDRIEDFFEEVASPLIGEVGVDISASSAERSGKKSLAYIFAGEKEERSQLAKELRTLAESTKGQIVWIITDPIESAQRASDLALKPGSWPAFALEDRANSFKFAFPKQGSMEELNRQAIGKIVDEFLAGKLEPSIKSEPIPTVQDEPVVNVVANNYGDLIMDNDKDVLVLYYSPSCKHCHAMAPSFDEVGKLLKPFADQVVVAKIDATNNDVLPVISSYPTLKLFKSGSKVEPILYNGTRTVESIIEFVKDNGSGDINGVMAKVLESIISKSPHDEL